MKTTTHVGQLIDTTNFKVNSQGLAHINQMVPDQWSIKLILRSPKQKYLQEKLIIIARYQWLRRNNLKIPEGEKLFNLCVQIVNGRVIRAFYSDSMTHIIKKLNYKIIILN